MHRLVYFIISPQLIEIIGESVEPSVVGLAVGEMLFLKLLPQFLSIFNETCHTCTL